MVWVHEFCLKQLRPHHTCENMGPLIVQILNFILLLWFLAYQAAFSIIICCAQGAVYPLSGQKSDLETVKLKGWTGAGEVLLRVLVRNWLVIECLVIPLVFISVPPSNSGVKKICSNSTFIVIDKLLFFFFLLINWQ